MFTPHQLDQLADLARRAEANPLDLRKLDRVMMDSLSLRFGTMSIAYAFERIPPDLQCYRHLSVSANGRPADETTFLLIARAVGMGDQSLWDNRFTRAMEHLPIPVRARHAFQPA